MGLMKSIDEPDRTAHRIMSLILDMIRDLEVATFLQETFHRQLNVDGSIELISIDEGNVVISGFDAVSADNSFVSFDPSLMTDQSFDICLSNDINDLISLMNHKLFLWFQQTNPLSVDRSFDRNERYHSIKDRMMKEPHI